MASIYDPSIEHQSLPGGVKPDTIIARAMEIAITTHDREAWLALGGTAKGWQSMQASRR